MRFLAFRKIIFLAVTACFYTGIAAAQEGEINISNDPKLDKLLTYQKEINENDDDEARYRIQIYNGNLKNAERARSRFQSKYYGVSVKIKFETPNYKVWVGNFRTSLEADRYLKDVQRTFPNAFKFRPQKKK